jgi:imidazole glycerol phosphate synthase glutamine amidotransferase subunit
MIGIVDYGAGNLLSVMNAMGYLNVECRLVRSVEDTNGMEGLILPGVGAFEPAMKMLRSKKLDRAIIEWFENDRPFLGICLGLQLLFERSEEAPGVKGLGLLKGDVVKFKGGRVPQIGWNQACVRKGSRLLKGTGQNQFYYFLHSYYVKPQEKRVVAATTEYGIEYASAIEKGNALGVQFHPEKSGDAGLKLLSGWVKMCAGHAKSAKAGQGGG